MRITSVTCQPVLGGGFQDTAARYVIDSDTPGRLVLSVHAGIAGGVSYTAGTAMVTEDVLELDCEAHSGENIEFELRAWTLTFAIAYEGARAFDSVRFAGETIRPRT